MLNYREITEKSTYVNKSWKLVKEVDGVRYDVYSDSRGYASMGVGFNLTKDNVRAAVYSKLGFRAGYNDVAISALEQSYMSQLDIAFASGSTQLQTDLNAIMLARAKDKHYTVTDISRRPTFTFSPANTGLTEMRGVFNNIRKIYDDYINSEIGTVPLSDERVTLFSLAYNNPDLLGPGLRTAISAGNRAEAWFEIRYHSNKEDGVPFETRKGLQKRRYLEAEMFNLYNKSPTEDDYKDAYRMFARHRDDVIYKQQGMLAYDTQFSGALAIAAGENSAVGTLKQELKPAYTSLINTYAADTGIAIDWRDVTVAEEGGAIVTGVIRNGDIYGTGTEVNDLSSAGNMPGKINLLPLMKAGETYRLHHSDTFAYYSAQRAA